LVSPSSIGVRRPIVHSTAVLRRPD
jgi:hypothetical protein